MWERRGQRDLRRGAVLGMRGPGLETGLGGGGGVWRGGGSQGHCSAASVPPHPPNLAPSPPAGPARRASSRDHPREAQTFFFPLCKNFFSLLPPARYGSSRSLPSYILPSDRSRR